TSTRATRETTAFSEFSAAPERKKGKQGNRFHFALVRSIGTIGHRRRSHRRLSLWWIPTIIRVRLRFPSASGLPGKQTGQILRLWAWRRRRLQPTRAPTGAFWRGAAKPTKPDYRPAASAEAGAYRRSAPV